MNGLRPWKTETRLGDEADHGHLVPIRRSQPTRATLGQKLAALNWSLVLLISAIAGVGFLMLYSAANGDLYPWAVRHAIRFGVCLVIMIGIALIDIRFWARIAYPGYAIALALLIMVEVMGEIGMGAQRWIDLGVMRFSRPNS